jgi:hypothetical protein
MSSSRISGSLGLAAEADGANGGALARLMPMLPGTVGLAKVGQELLLDFAQMALDLVGVIDPTPISDGTSMVISLGRREYSGAAISGLSMVPCIGDLAKSAKLGRYLATLERAADAAARSPLIRGPLLRLARGVAAALEEARGILPRSARVRVDEALLRLEKSLGGGRLLALRIAPNLERVALQLLEVGLRLRPGQANRFALRL